MIDTLVSSQIAHSLFNILFGIQYSLIITKAGASPASTIICTSCICRACPCILV